MSELRRESLQTRVKISRKEYDTLPFVFASCNDDKAGPCKSVVLSNLSSTHCSFLGRRGQLARIIGMPYDRF